MAMNQLPEKGSFIISIRNAREEWQTTWDAADKEHRMDKVALTQPGAGGSWSAKDVIAHVTWHEREMVGMIRRRALVGSELWNLPTDERNAAIYALNKDRSLAEVLEEAQKVYTELLEQLEMLSDEDLHNPGHFTGMPPDWEPWKVIAGNTYEHYPEHAIGLD